MSSYFDRMARVLADETGVEFVRLIRDQYGHYMESLDRDLVRGPKDRDLERFHQEFLFPFHRRFSDERIVPQRTELARLLQDMHTFAHNLGSAGFRLRGGRRAGDNPPIYY